MVLAGSSLGAPLRAAAFTANVQEFFLSDLTEWLGLVEQHRFRFTAVAPAAAEWAPDPPSPRSSDDGSSDDEDAEAAAARSLGAVAIDIAILAPETAQGMPVADLLELIEEEAESGRLEKALAVTAEHLGLSRLHIRDTQIHQPERIVREQTSVVEALAAARTAIARAEGQLAGLSAGEDAAARRRAWVQQASIDALPPPLVRLLAQLRDTRAGGDATAGSPRGVRRRRSSPTRAAGAQLKTLRGDAKAALADGKGHVELLRLLQAASNWAPIRVRGMDVPIDVKWNMATDDETDEPILQHLLQRQLRRVSTAARLSTSSTAAAVDPRGARRSTAHHLAGASELRPLRLSVTGLGSSPGGSTGGSPSPRSATPRRRRRREEDAAFAAAASFGVSSRGGVVAPNDAAGERWRGLAGAAGCSAKRVEAAAETPTLVRRRRRRRRRRRPRAALGGAAGGAASGFQQSDPSASRRR